MESTKLNILTESRAFLWSWSKKREEYCINAQVFTREGKLGFIKTAVLVLFLLKRSLDIELCDFFDIIDEIENECTKSAFSQSRYKIKVAFFREWQEHLATTIYSSGIAQTWRGLRVQAVDGTRAYLFDRPDVVAHFGCQTNQHKVRIPMAQIVVCYDVLNRIAVKGAIHPIKNGERSIAYHLLDACNEQTLTLYDRNFHTFAFMWAHQQRGSYFVMRGRTHEIWLRKFIQSGLESQIITLTATESDRATAKKQGQKVFDKGVQLRVRLIRVVLDSGEIEVLITNLLDENAFPTQDFSQVYFWRWREETYFDVLKNKLQLEIFSGLSPTAIQQEFYALLLLSSLHAFCTPQPNDDPVLIKINQSRTLNYQVNMNTTLALFKKTIIKWMIQDDWEKDVLKWQIRARRHLEPIRPNRKFQRTKRKKRLNGKYRTLPNYKRAV